MCDPISIGVATAAVGGASAIMSFVGQNAAAHRNEVAANLAYAQTENQIGERGVQINQQQSENLVQAEIDRAAAGGRINAAAAASGADQATTTRATDAASSAAGRALSIENINSENARLGLVNDQAGAFYRRQSQINQVLPQSPIQLALGLAKAAAGGASAYGNAGGLFGGFDNYGSTAITPGDGADLAMNGGAIAGG